MLTDFLLSVWDQLPNQSFFFYAQVLSLVFMTADLFNDFKVAIIVSFSVVSRYRLKY